jgi:VanZ family protein
MNLKSLTISYILFLVIVSAVLDLELVPEPRVLVKKYVPRSVLPQKLPHRIPYDDKIAHFFLAGALSLLVNLNLSLSHVTIGKIKFLKGSMILLIVLIVEECSQSFFPSRSLSWKDLVSGYAGVLCFGQIAMYLVKNRAAIEPKLPRIIATTLYSRSK